MPEEIEMKTAYLEVVLRIPVMGLSAEEQVEDLGVPEDEVMQASENDPEDVIQAVIDHFTSEYGQDELWEGTNLLVEIQKGTKILAARWSHNPDEPLSDMEQAAVHIFKKDHASDDLELDINSVHPEQGKPTTAGSEDGVWVRCWKFVPMDELKSDGEDPS